MEEGLRVVKLSNREFICPICGGIHKSLLSLRIHVRKGHDDLWKKCPICNRELKCSIVHYRRIKDDKHRELWILTVSRRNSEGSIGRMAGEYLEIVKARNGDLDGMG
jgi:transcription elongation factor Elf1